MRKSLVWLFLALAWAPAMAGQPDSVIVAFPLDEPIPQIFDDLPALVVSPETVLVVVPQEVMPSSLGRARAVGFKRHLPTWLAYGTSDTRIEGGTIYFSMPSRWIFAGDSQVAQGLRAEGLSVVPLRWVKLDRIMAPHFGERLTRQILSQRDRRFIKDLQEQLSAEIDTTAMVEHLYYLTFDSLTQSYRSRYACRSETATEIAPYLTGLLQAYLGSDWSIETMHFEIPFCPEGTDLINVIASRPGKQTSAFYVVCAHYDATAHRDSAWDWQTDPAPGADDNASSVVALLECARLLADVGLDVGLRFIAFSGEEQGRRGSEYYVDHLSESDSIIGVINLDMLGYAEPAKLIEITYDWKSYWLASLLSASIDSGFDLALVTKNRTGIYNSDHGSFWAYGIPGVMLNDRTEESGVPAYPYYHTTADTAGNVDISQVCDVVKLVTGFLSQFAAAPPESLVDIVLSPSSIELKWQGRDWGDPLVAGGEVTARVRATNLGASMLEPHAYSFDVWAGESSTGDLIHADTVEVFLASGMHTDIEVSWKTDPDTYGDLVFTFGLLPIDAGIEADTTNNVASITQEVMPRHLVLDRLHIYPNPVSDPAGANLAFSFLYRDTDPVAMIYVSIFDLTGRKVGGGKLRLTNVFKEFQVGYNRDIPLRDFLFDHDLAPGLYLLVARSVIVGEPDQAIERALFAVDR